MCLEDMANVGTGSGAGYECCCGFKSSRATNFLRHIKESAVPGGQTHRLVEADAERLAQVENQLCHSPEQPRQTHQPSRATGRQSNNGESRLAAVLNDKEGSAPRYGTNGRVPSSGGQANGKHSRKRTDCNPHSDHGATTKRQATADVSAPADFNPISFGVDGPHASSTQAPHIAAGSAGANTVYNTRSRSQQRADQLFDRGAQNAHASTIHNLPNVRADTERTGQQRSHAASGGMQEIHADPFVNPPSHAIASDHSTAMRGHEPGGSDLPVSQAACFDDSLQAALTRRRVGGGEIMRDAELGNPLFDPHGQNASGYEPFLPDSWDADALAEWFVYLISWQNWQHSMQGLVGGLYLLAFTQELWERVSWTPISVVALLALFAVGHSALPAGMPALSKLLRKAGYTDQTGTVVRASQAFQELSVAAPAPHPWKAMWIDCKELAADISCTALQSVSDVAQMWAPPLPLRMRSGSARGQSSQSLLHETTSGKFEGVQSDSAVGLSLNEVVKAGLILLQRASHFRSASHTVATLSLLWSLLFLSESAILSQWNCAMAAYTSCFCWRTCWGRYGNLLEELLQAVGGVLPLLCSHHYRSHALIASSSAVTVMWFFGALALVPRITVAGLTGLVCLLWQLQRHHQHRKQHTD